MRITPEHITELKPNEIFVFGANEKGAHGLGAAEQAVQWGAKYGQGEGLMGQTYGIPTKDKNIKTLDLLTIYQYVNKFIKFVENRQDLTFLVTAVGTGLAGHPIGIMAQMFKKLYTYENVYLPKSFIDMYLQEPFNKEKYWDNLKRIENVEDVPTIPNEGREKTINYYAPKLIKAGAIPMKDLIDKECYLGKCRRGRIARWDANKNVFIYWRHKFGNVFEEEINHFEDDDQHDVFVPIKIVNKEEYNKTKI